MVFSMIAKPGTELGPCKAMCQHRDCAASRADAKKICPGCEKLIGYETQFCVVRDKGSLPWVWHRVCAEDDKYPATIKVTVTLEHIQRAYPNDRET